MLVQKELKNAYIGIPNPTSIVLDKSYISLTTIGQTKQLTATIEPTVSDKTITWSSDDTTVATVSTTGLVTCVTPGTCTITATTVNGLTATCSVDDNQGWQPTVNTIAYFPFSSNSTDQTGNNTLTNSGTQNGLGWEFSSGSNITTPSGTINYVNFWIQINNYGSTNNGICLYNKRGIGYYAYQGHSYLNKKIFVWYDSNFSQEAVDFAPTTGTRHNISYGYDGTKTIYSIDGVSGTLYNGIGYDFGDSFMVAQKGGVVISKLILEDTCWTSAEILNYYNQTKSDYGL